jgi:outer membrane protein OmpA-like peptidoglycan-associated protein
MNKSYFSFLIIIVQILVFSLSLHAQDNVRNQLFGEANQMLEQVKEKKADLLAPTSYDRAMKYYNEATADFGKGANLEDIREKVKNAMIYFAKALDDGKAAEVTLRGVMAARTDAASAGAMTHSAELWKKGESQFNQAARELESGSETSARRTAGEAEASFRSAELEAIKTNYLAPARVLLKQADDLGVKENAPNALGRAKKFVAQVEDLLKQNRYDTDEARQLAQEAKYEAAHAIYLHRIISEMKQKDKTFEDVMVQNEAYIQDIASAVGVRARFDEGTAPPVKEIIAAIKERDAKIKKDASSLLESAETIRGKESEIDNLKQRVSSMENRVGSLTETERQLKEAGNELQRKLNTQYEQEETIRQVAGMFTEDEGSVVRDGNNIIIRLYGLSFPVGQNIIEPQYDDLLLKVQNAIKKFPKCTTAIEGHTDSQGSDEANQILSEARAKAVAEYLMANMGVEIPVKSQGFGESRPVASNDTPDGRAKNRRIDVVITPEWATKGK